MNKPRKKGKGKADLPVRSNGLHPNVLGVRGKALVKPKVVPPLHGDEISKPLMGQFVRDDGGHPLLAGSRASGLVVQQRRLPVGN